MRYKTIMVGTKSYARIASAREAMRRKSGLKLSFEDIIMDLIDRRLELSPMDDRLKRYIEKAALEISELDGIDGILLFGSVAKGTYNKNSDIDLAIFTKSRKLDILESVMAIKGSLGSEAISLMKAGLPHSLSPIALDRGDAKAFKPFYFDLADYGIILYEKADSVSKFIDSVKWKKHRREVVKGVEVITW